MTIPTSYTSETFAAYLHRQLGPVTPGILGWSVDAGSYDDILTDTLVALGYEDVMNVSGRENLRKLRALGLVYLWRSVVSQLAVTVYNVSTPAGSFSRGRLAEQARTALTLAEQEAAGLGLPLPSDVPPVELVDVVDSTNPYPHYQSGTANPYSRVPW